MKYTQHTLDKIEKVIEEAGYIVRYERGSFQSGFCILEDKKVVVLNKFLQLEGRINTLIDLIPQLRIDGEALTPDARKWFDEITARHAANTAEKEEKERKKGKEKGNDEKGMSGEGADDNGAGSEGDIISPSDPAE